MKNATCHQEILAKAFKISHILDTNEECDMPSRRISAARLATEKSYNKTMLIIISLFVIVWFPFMIILIIGTAYQIKKDIPGIWLQKAFMWTSIITYINGAISPFIYAIGYKETGKEMRKVILTRAF